MLLTPLQRARLLSFFQKKRAVPCVCRRDSEAPEARYAIREITLNAKNVSVDISSGTLSPKAASREDLAAIVRALIDQSASGPVKCGEPERSFDRATLEAWLACTNEPVLQIIEK